MAATPPPPEYNVTGIDYTDQRHFRYAGLPLIDVHAHVMQTRPPDPKEGEPVPEPTPALEQADTMLAVAAEFSVARIYSMCPPDDIPALRERFGPRLGFNASVTKMPQEPDDAAYRLLDRFVELGAEIVKFWAAPRGHERGLYVDTPWRIELARRARAAGIGVIMVHVADPDLWFRKKYTDVTKFKTKIEHYVGLVRMLEMFPDLTWVAAHMGGDPEHPDHLEALLERYPHLHFDTSAAKWQVREVSAQREAIRSLIGRHPRRFLFGSDLVTRQGLVREHYVSRYWCHRTLWESTWEGPSPIADPDAETPPALRGLGLPLDVLQQVYHDNALRLLPGGKSTQASSPARE
jgi:predicted TIM-barrel fold metal-dependent hydrolase